MASILTANLNLDLIPKDKVFQGKKGKYLQVTIAINDELGAYNDNGSITVGQSVEERTAKAPKIYLANPKVVWTNGENVAAAPRDGEAQTLAPVAASAPADDLPF